MLHNGFHNLFILFSVLPLSSDLIERVHYPSQVVIVRGYVERDSFSELMNALRNLLAGIFLINCL